jgi:hypothetical protein
MASVHLADNFFLAPVGLAAEGRIEALHTGALHLPLIGHQPIQACKRVTRPLPVTPVAVGDEW